MKITYLTLDVWPNSISFEERQAFEREYSYPEMLKKAEQQEMKRLKSLF